MRSACWGARSVRSLMTIRPLVVSITIAFCLSRPAGSGWAIAGAAQISATMKTRARIMKTPDQVKGEACRKLRAVLSQNRLPFLRKNLALTGEFGLQAGRDRLRHERREVAAHAGDLAHQCGGDRADGNRGRKE